MWEPGAQQKIKSWKQVRNTFPDVPLKLYGAGTSSGTYDYFTEAIVGTAKSSRGDYTASEDDNVLVEDTICKPPGRVSDKTAFFYIGELIEYDATDKIFTNPQQEKMQNYVTGRFG